MADPTVPTDPADLAAVADHALERWLEDRSLADRSTGRTQPRRGERLVDAYRGVAIAVLTQVSSSRPGERIDLDRGAEDIVPRIVKAARAEHLTIAEVFRDLSALRRALEDAEATRTGRRPSSGLERAFAELMDRAAVGVAESLEAASLRERREHEDMVATMTDVLSHELENRLGAARTAADVLLHPELDIDAAGVERTARLVRRSLDDALRTVEDVRALTARHANLEEPRRRLMRLPELVRALAEEARANALESGVDVRIEGELPDAVVDAARTRLILVNLLQNGVKYRSPTAERPHVTVEARRLDDENVELRVSDNGVGISPDDMDQLFLPRFRGHVADEIEGSGLGLAIVEEAVTQIGGEIAIESEVGIGTTFVVVLPGPAAERPGDDAPRD